MNKKKIPSTKFRLFLLLTALLAVAGCKSPNMPLPIESYVDLETFMGTWYVVGYTPILVDGDAHNATEHYALKENGRIATTYEFRKGAFDGPLKTYRPTGFIYNEESNAEWRMQFIWPFKAEYLIMHYDEPKGETIVAHSNRKYAWIMLREPSYKEETYARLLQMLVDQGFDPEQIKRLPQDWSQESRPLIRD